jgi:DNA polymerase family A/3'-5' exonuclease
MYSIIRKANRKPRTPIAFSPDLLVPGFWAIDLETNGTDASNPECRAVGIGLANDTHCFYIDFNTINNKISHELQLFLRESSFTAFNVVFDGAFLLKVLGFYPNFVSDTYALFKQMSTEGFDGQRWNLETAQIEVLGWDLSNKTTLHSQLKKHALTKAEMYKLPVEILGPYCAADADSAWQLHHELRTQCENYGAGSNLLDYHSRIFLPQVKLLIEQQLRGLEIDQTKLKEYQSCLDKDIESFPQKFFQHPLVSPHIEVYDKLILDAWKASEPPRQYKRWLVWQDKGLNLPKFNVNSKKQLIDLFYNKLEYKILTRTKSGRPTMDRKVLPLLGTPGKMLAKHNLLVKRAGYVRSLVDKTTRDGLLHAQFNSVGTLTTRLGGSGGLNLQQMPKVKEFLECFRARDGHVLVQADAESIEPTILAEFSQDTTLLSIYGKNSKPNDIYLFIASKIPSLGKDIRKYYDPENPTSESIGLAKTHCKKDRDIAKQCYLAYNYGAGAKKMHEGLTFAGVDISLGEIREIRSQLDRIFSGVKRFERQLVDIWRHNGGWIPSILGTPICIDQRYLKDIVNRFCQTSGHLVLQLWIYNIQWLLEDKRLPAHPWLVDFHDETIWEVSEQFELEVVSVINYALSLTNQELGTSIPIKGPPMIANTLADIKCKE